MSTKDQIITAADILFYAGSIREVSVERIAEKAGVTKKTFYYHFQSKDELVATYLEARLKPTIERYQKWAGLEGALADRIERMFNMLAASAEKQTWKGCGFLRAAVELADSPGHPALAVARRHKAAFEEWLADDIRSAGFADAFSLARMIMVLLDGAVARMLVQKDPSYARDAAKAARLLLESQTARRPVYTD